MLGFSYYLNDPLNEKTEKYFATMASHTFQEVFTSLHIPEDDSNNKSQRMQDLMKLAEYNGLSVVVDVDKASLQYLPHNLTSKLTLRLDDGFTASDISDISQQMPVALNASTLNDQVFYQLQKEHVDLTNVEAWHNFYPRPETGLDTQWFADKNHWLKSMGFKTQAFIPGDENLRGPLNLGLPTLEKHRQQNILASAIELDNLGVDKIIIGDPGLSQSMQEKIKNYFVQDILNLDYSSSTDISEILIPGKTYSNRPDPARDVIRIKESRQQNDQLIPATTEHVERAKGMITIDNELYGRYMGEVQIIKHNLAADSKVNTIAEIADSDLDLIDHIGADQRIQFNHLKG